MAGKSGGGFFAQVYDMVERIPAGRVMTYGQIGKLLGGKYSGRTVGFAMRAAPPERKLPCHRVVNIKGEMAPSYAFGSQRRQRDMLKKEGVVFRPDGRIDVAASLWHPGKADLAKLSRKGKTTKNSFKRGLQRLESLVLCVVFFFF